MPITKRNGKYYWGRKGPFDSRDEAKQVASAAYASGYEKSLLKLMKKDTSDDPNWTPYDEQGLAWAERESSKDKARALDSVPGSSTPKYEALLTHQAFSREGERPNFYSPAVGDSFKESIPNFPVGEKETRPLHPYNIGYDPKTLRRDRAYREAKVRNLQNSAEASLLMKGIPLQKIQLPDENTRGGREEIERIEQIAQKVRPDLHDTIGWEGGSSKSKSPLDHARSYLNGVRDGGRTAYIDHVAGHDALAQVHNIMNYGEDYEDHPDAIKYDINKRARHPETGRHVIGHDAPGSLTLNQFHRDHVNDAIHHSVSNKGLGLMDELHRRIRMESPQWNPDDLRFTHAQAPASMTDTQSGGFTESVEIPGQEEITPEQRAADPRRGGMVPGQHQGYVDRPWWPKTHHRDPENMPQGETEGYPPRSEQNFGYPSFESRRQEYDENVSPAMGGGIPQRKPKPKSKGAFETDPDIQQYFSIENSVQKLRKFVELRKIGYTTQPEDKFEPYSGRSQELTPAWEGGSEAVKKVGRDIGNQSFGLPALGSKAHQNILDTVSKTKDVSFAPSNSGLKSSEHISHTPGSTPAWLAHTAFDPLSEAHTYLNSIQNQRHNSSVGTHNYNEIDMHMAGHRALATVQNIMQFGEEYLDHPDAIRYLKHVRNPKWNARDEEAADKEGREYEEPYYSSEVPMWKPYNAKGEWPHTYATARTIPLEEYHKQLVHGHLDHSMSNTGKGMADELHSKIRMESPHFDPEAEEAYALNQWPASFHSTISPSYIGGGRYASGGGEGLALGPLRFEEEVGGDTSIDRDRENLRSHFPTHEARREAYGKRDEEVVRRRQSQAKPNVFESRFPDLYGDKEKSVAKLMKFIRKEEEPAPIDLPNYRQGGIQNAAINFNETLPDTEIPDFTKETIGHPETYNHEHSRDGTINRWRKNSFPRYWYHTVPAHNATGTDDGSGGIKAYEYEPNMETKFSRHAMKTSNVWNLEAVKEQGEEGGVPGVYPIEDANNHVVWLAQVPYGNPQWVGSGTDKETAYERRLTDPRLHQESNVRGVNGRQLRIIDMTKLDNKKLRQSGYRHSKNNNMAHFQHLGDIPYEAIVDPRTMTDATEPITHYWQYPDTGDGEEMHWYSHHSDGKEIGRWPRERPEVREKPDGEIEEVYPDTQMMSEHSPHWLEPQRKNISRGIHRLLGPRRSLGGRGNRWQERRAMETKGRQVAREHLEAVKTYHGKNIVQRLFPHILQGRPVWGPKSKYYTQQDKSMTKLMKFIYKEGTDGGAFNGLSGTVFTSTNAGIFTPSYGGDGTKKKHHRNHKRQDKKRRKLMGKEKKSGVERLVQYLYEGSPTMSKARKMGLAPGLDDDMTGDGATAHAWNNKATGPMRLTWKKDMSEDTLNHKKTSRPLEDAIKVAENNEPHINMGLAGGMEAAIAAAYPQEEDPSVMNASNPRKAEWVNNSYVQKAANEGTTMTSPTENKPWSLDAPQDKYVERTRDNPNESPAKNAVVEENDMQRRVKKYDNKEDEGHEPYQAEGVMAAAGMGGYPSGATMQMSSFGMNTYEQDALSRGGEEDTLKDGEDNDELGERLDEDGNMWIPENPDKTKNLESMRKALEDAGDETPLVTALYKLDHS